MMTVYLSRSREGGRVDLCWVRQVIASKVQILCVDPGKQVCSGVGVEEV
jgi:hypothetical protein